MIYTWTEELAVGDAQIDQDHQHLYARVNTLLEAVNTRKGNNTLIALLDEVVNSTIAHFAHEEALMQQIDYAGAVEHRTAHEALLKEARKLQTRVANGSLSLSLDAYRFLCDWLRNHIATQDKALGAALRARPDR